MGNVIPFPQQQHEAFCQLVLDEVSRLALARGISMEECIRGIYLCGEEPALFSDREKLQELYRQYRDLVESAVSSLENRYRLSKANKAYLCFRIYLHAMTLERNVMSESGARQCLLQAMRDYFFAHDRLLTQEEEILLLKQIDEALYRAPLLDSS